MMYIDYSVLLNLKKEGIFMEKINLKALQDVELGILKDFINICDTYNLKYVLAYGTCIGAIRHKGFIPWDDDIDVAMPRKDYEKLINIADEVMGDKYVLQTYNSEKNCGLIFGKIRKNGTIMSEVYSHHIDMHQGVWIDIFPYDNVPDDEIERKKIFQKIYIYKNLYIIKSGYKLPENKKNLLNYSVYYLSKFFMTFIPLDLLIKNIDRLVKKYNDIPCQFMACYGDNIIENIMPCEMMDNLIEVDFEDCKAKVFHKRYY